MVHASVHPPNRKKGALQSEIRNHVLAGSAIFADELKSYDGLDEFQHEAINHDVAYVDGPTRLQTPRLRKSRPSAALCSRPSTPAQRRKDGGLVSGPGQ